MTPCVNGETNTKLVKNMMSNQQNGSSPNKGKILVVDDALLHLETVKLYLEADGYEVFCATNTGGAWAILNKDKPDLVLLDVVMPGENGLDLLRNLKVQFPHIGVVLMTAFGSEEIAAMALKLGAFDYIKKPFKYCYLSDVVHKVLTKQNQVKDRNKKIEHLQTELHNKEKLLIDRERLAIVGQMAAGMAHEIKNPLTTIKGFVQLLARSADPATKMYLDIIESETNRMNQVIQDFLQLAKPKSPETKLVTINELIDEMIPMIKHLALINNHDLIVKTEGNIPPVLIDPAQIKQVILNLCQNGMEAMERGGELTIETGFLPEQGEVHLDITDTGCGIQQENFKSVGVPFFTTKADGTGLGLSICFSIVDKHKGRIEIQSQAGSGTTFSVVLPVVK
ncbi:MAG: response regulator [Bacillota bacterium]|nr:response regulator [Bacillota bacterium]